MNSPKTLSIIIVSWNTKTLLKKCILSITQNKNPNVKEVIIVDNASSDGTREMLKDLNSDHSASSSWPRGSVKLHYIFNKKNQGFARANNQGIQTAKGEYYLLLNPDTELSGNTVEVMLSFFTSHKDCALLGCKHLNGDGTIQPSVRRFPTLLSQTLVLLKINRLLPNNIISRRYMAKDFNYNATQEAEQIAGSCFMIKKEIVNTIGHFDENFFIWFEEVDYCKRVKNAGLKIFYTHEAVIIHHGAQSFQQIFPFEKQKKFNQSLLYYFKKHHTFISYFILSILNYPSLFLTRLHTKFQK